MLLLLIASMFKIDLNCNCCSVLHIGVLVLACHELNDIFLEGAKMARYARAPEWVSTLLFVCKFLFLHVSRFPEKKT
jgi:hypothetical protein